MNKTLKIAIIICLIVFVVWPLISSWLEKSFFKPRTETTSSKRTKQSIAEYYNITRPTLTKWIRNFQSDISVKDWKKAKFITDLEFDKLKEVFGESDGKAYSKKAILHMAGTRYKTLSEHVKPNLEKIGLTKENWNSSSVFPPKYGRLMHALL